MAARSAVRPCPADGAIVELAGAVVEVASFRLGPVDVELHWGDRAAVVGANGSGKTPLIRALLGELPLAAGERRTGGSVVLGELTQTRDLFDDPVLDDFSRLSGLTSTAARTLLASTPSVPTTSTGPRRRCHRASAREPRSRCSHRAVSTA